MTRKGIIIGVAIAVVVGLFFLLRSFNDITTVQYPGGELEVLVADNAIEHQKGLSGTRIETLGADGMLFVFSEKEERVFWMNGMNYALDVVWIADEKVMKIDRNVPAPEPGEDPERMYSRPFQIDMVLEVPAGMINDIGLVEGHLINVEGYGDEE